MHLNPQMFEYSQWLWLLSSLGLDMLGLSMESSRMYLGNIVSEECYIYRIILQADYPTYLIEGLLVEYVEGNERLSSLVVIAAFSII